MNLQLLLILLYCFYIDALNVKDYGAFGDGMRDDTSAIQTAIGTLGGGTLFFPTGTYILSNELLINTLPLSVYGEGVSVSVLQGTLSLVVLK